MLKFVDTKVVFSEVPDEVTLAINISNCPCYCHNCHSSYLAEDVGEPLDVDNLDSLITSNGGITCVAIMGGDIEPIEVNNIAKYIKYTYNLKVAWYSGREEISKDINLWYFDFIKVGPYIEERGPLNKETTNQIFYKVVHTSMGKSKLFNITNKFWRNETKD